MSQDLSNLISQAVAAKMSPEFIEKEVDTRVEKLVIEAIDRSLRSYSDVGKLVEAAVTEALKVDRLDLPSYGHVVTQMLKRQIETRVAEVIAGRLEQDMNELLSLAPKEVKLSDIAKEMVQWNSEHGPGQVVTVIVDRTEYGSAWLYLDEDEVYDHNDRYKADYRLLISKDGSISSVTFREQDFAKTKHFGRAYRLEQKLRAYVACGTIIILDEDYVSTSVGDY